MPKAQRGGAAGRPGTDAAERCARRGAAAACGQAAHGDGDVDIATQPMDARYAAALLPIDEDAAATTEATTQAPPTMDTGAAAAAAAAAPTPAAAAAAAAALALY